MPAIVKTKEQQRIFATMRALTDILATLVICAGLFGEMVAGAMAMCGRHLDPEPGFWIGVLSLAVVLWGVGWITDSLDKRI